MIRAPRLIGLLVIAAILVGASTSAAQACRYPTAVALNAGYAAYDVAGGTAGPALGVEAAFPAGALSMRVGYRHVLLDGGGAAPDVVRASAAYPTTRVRGIALCTDILAGLTRFAARGNTGVSLAGGVGGTIMPAGAGALRPYLSVRGLAALTTGTIVGEQVYAVGVAVGVEAGLEARVGAVVARLSVARDGLDDGLGATPFPNTAVGLAVGYRF